MNKRKRTEAPRELTAASVLFLVGILYFFSYPVSIVIRKQKTVAHAKNLCCFILYLSLVCNSYFGFELSLFTLIFSGESDLVNIILSVDFLEGDFEILCDIFPVFCDSMQKILFYQNI